MYMGKSIIYTSSKYIKDAREAFISSSIRNYYQIKVDRADGGAHLFLVDIARAVLAGGRRGVKLDKFIWRATL